MAWCLHSKGVWRDEMIQWDAETMEGRPGAVNFNTASAKPHPGTRAEATSPNNKEDTGC